MLEVKELEKVYKSESKEIKVLENINFIVSEGGSLSIVGPSGSGKSTLLGLCAGLDHPTNGEIKLNGIVLNQLNEDQLADIRNQYIGFVFQNFQLIPTLTALENVMVPLELRGMKNCSKIAKNLIERVGLKERMTHYPTQLSGGEQQRIAIARAFSNNPKILFTDEPTGNLDRETGIKIEKLLFELNQENKTTLIIVTHDTELSQKTSNIIKLKGGKIVH